MKRMLLASFLFGLLGAGCMPEAHQVLKSDGVQKAAVRPAPPPVLPDQVTPANAHEMAQRLGAELNFAEPAPPAGMEIRDAK